MKNDAYCRSRGRLYKALTVFSLFGTRFIPVVRDGFLLVPDPPWPWLRDMVRDYPLPPEGYDVRHRQELLYIAYYSATLSSCFQQMLL